MKKSGNDSPAGAREPAGGAVRSLTRGNPRTKE